MTGPEAPPPIYETPVQKGLARVHIYGAGVAGLTAAHELARRGFRVRVYEHAVEYDERGKREGGSPSSRFSPEIAVGGMARSQFLRAARGALGNFPKEGRFTTCDQYRLRYPVPLDEAGRTAWKDEPHDKERLLQFVNRCGFFSDSSPGILHIRLPPTADDSRYAAFLEAARAVRRYLSQVREPEPGASTSAHLAEDRVIIVSREEEWDLIRDLASPFPGLDENAEALLLEVFYFLPGEHGFRFFPSYYRHLFSTMVETPILDAQGGLTGRRIFDNLVPSSFYGIAAQGRRIRFLRRAPVTRPVEMLQELGDLASSGYPPTDALQFSLRIWRYLCTCSERRRAEYEGISWWEYLEGYDPKTGARRYQYSRAFKQDMQFAPRVLAAFDGAWGDARTNGNTLAQLYLNNLMPMPKTDGTLNGPTTVAWFRPWRHYLEAYLGVEFRQGSLMFFQLEDDRLVPYIDVNGTAWAPWVDTHEKPRPPGTEPGKLEEPVDYYVVATDAQTAEQTTNGLPPIGVIQGLRSFTSCIPPNPRGPEPEQPRDWERLPGYVPWDRFQTLTGIQFFFPSSVRFAEGYLYFLDAPWGLSAINSQQYWASPPSFGKEGFASVLSVDIGNWYVREPWLKSPSDCSRREIAVEVWEQIRKATEQHNAPLPHASHFGFTLPEPAWYHVDRFIRFDTDPATRRERPGHNLAPYLIPIMGDWERRPGADPWDPLAPPAVGRPRVELPEGLWQAPHGGYQVHWGRLVFAGTYLRTFTRMTTMESANESARHAVNAIIDHYLAHPRPPPKEEPEPKPAGVGIRGAPAMPDFGGQGSLTGSPDFRMTPIGEYCRIWDPEKHELAELAPLRELDSQLFAAGLPHVWDVLRLEPMLLPLLPPNDPLRGIESLKSFLGSVRESLRKLSPSAWPGLRWPPP
ncbi:NAD(P)-binding protein [Pyxidicoccus sp. 3LG]